LEQAGGSNNVTKVIFTCTSKGTTLALAAPAAAAQTAAHWGKVMDSASILMILFGSLISVTTALTFMEVRRMRKSPK
jgi:hypothetical protein